MEKKIILNPVKTYARFENYHWWFIARRRIVREIVLQILPPSRNSLIIDIGCGPGANIAAFAATHPCLGVDNSAEAIQIARERYPMVRFLEGIYPLDLGETTREAKLFLIMDVVEHLENPRVMLENIVASASVGAYFLVTVPADPTLWSAHDIAVGHFRRYTTNSLAALFTGLQLVPIILTPYNSRLFYVIKALRFMNWLLRRGFARTASEGTDLRIPPYPFNGILTALFSYEAIPISRALRNRTPSPFRRGVSLIYLLEKSGG